MIYSCSSSGGDDFFGSWQKEYEEEVDGWGFCNQYERLTLNNDYTFSQSWAYLDGTKTDTIAKVTIGGKWAINDSCLELEYDPKSITATSVIFENEPIFFNEILTKSTYVNEQLESAHAEDSTFGIKKVAVIGDKIVSTQSIENEDTIEVYSRCK